MKKYLSLGITFIILLSFSGCVETETDPSIESDPLSGAENNGTFDPYIPKNTDETTEDLTSEEDTTNEKIEKQVFELDFDGDGVNEKVELFSSRLEMEVFYGENMIMHDQVEIFTKEDEEWKLVNKYLYPNEEYLPKDGEEITFLKVKSVEVIDIGDDGNEELIIKETPAFWNSYGLSGYKLIGFEDGRINELTYTDGWNKMLESGGAITFHGGIMDVYPRDDKLVEKWGGLCESGKTPCYTFEFEISYNPETGEWGTSDGMNKTKVEQEWNEYEEMYSDALEWDEELPF